MEDLRKYTKRTELYKLSAEEQTEKMKLVMSDESIVAGYINYLHKQKKDNKF